MPQMKQYHPDPYINALMNASSHGTTTIIKDRKLRKRVEAETRSIPTLLRKGTRKSDADTIAEKLPHRLRSAVENGDNPSLKLYLELCGTPKETPQRLLRKIRKGQVSTREARAKALGTSIADVKAEDEFENELFWGAQPR